jgi:serine/threonine-protein kinase
MLTGRQLFTGETVSETLAAVLMREPDFSTLPLNLHPRIRLLLERCLEKEPKNRYHDIADVRVDIQKALADPSGVLVQPVTIIKPRRGLRLGLPWVAAAVVLAAIIAGLAVWKLKLPEPHQVIRSEYTVPEGQQLGSDLPTLAVSPDGKQFVYSTPKGLYVRSLDEFDAKLIIGTETNPVNPFFSPDGKWIGYFSRSDNKLKKLAISGGAPVTLCDASFVLGANWGADDRIVYGDYPKGIQGVSANGGTPELILKGYLILPQPLPDGKSVLFTSGPPPYKIIVQSLQSGERKELFAGDSARYLSTGHIVYGVENNLLAVPFDLKTLKVTGGPIPVVEGVWRATANRAPHYAVSDSGTLAYIPGKTGAAGQRTLVWVDRKGKDVPIAAAPNSYDAPRISPDGTRVALDVGTDNKSDIWILDLLRETMTRLTFNESSECPIWTPDGKRIAFGSGPLPKTEVYWKAADGTGADERLSSEEQIYQEPMSWSRDGKTLLITMLSLKTNSFRTNIDALPMEGSHNLKPLLQDNFNETYPKISPDGRWVAYVSDESGKGEIYVRPFPEVNKGKWQVSTSGGDIPLWSPDGRELFYLSYDSVMAVSVETRPTLSFGTPKTLFRLTYIAGNTYPGMPWDISPDGKRFLMIKEVGPTGKPAEAPRKINIVLNWIDELKQRVPGK